MDTESLKMLNACIGYWESTLFHDAYLIDVTTRVFLENTIKFLKELRDSGANRAKQAESA